MTAGQDPILVQIALVFPARPAKLGPREDLTCGGY